MFKLPSVGKNNVYVENVVCRIINMIGLASNAHVSVLYNHYRVQPFIENVEPI